MPTAREILADNEYKVATRAEFEADTGKPAGLNERMARFGAGCSHVIYDPEGGDHGYMIWGCDPDAMADEAVAHLELSS